MSAAPSRPRDVAMASVLTIMGSVLALAGIFGAKGELRSSSVRREIETVLADQRFATVDLSVDALLNLIEYGLMAAAAASVAAIVLAVFVLRRHNPSRIALTWLGGLSAVFVLVSGLSGIVIAVFVGYTLSLLWRAPVRTWFAGAVGSGGEGSRPDAGRSASYWGMSGAGGTNSGGPGGTGPGGTGPGGTGPGGTGPGGTGPGGPGGTGADGEPEPSRNPDAVPDPDPRWPSDPAQPGSGPDPYPQPWPPEPGDGRHGDQPWPAGHGQHRPYGHPDSVLAQPGPWGQQDQPSHPEHPNQPGQPEEQRTQQGPGRAAGYPGPPPSEQQHGYGHPSYPTGGPGYPGGVQGYPGGYPYHSGYGYPPASGDPYRRPGQVVAAHVLTWVGAAFGLVTGVFFVAAGSNQDVVDLVKEQLAAGDVAQREFTAMLIAAGVVSVLWSLAVVIASVFSWRGHNWAAILLTVMGGGYLVVQLFTLLTGQLAVLFTIVWVAVVLALLWWPASRQWYAAQRTGRHDPQGPHGPQNPYDPQNPYGAPYQQPPHHNRPW